MKRLLIICLVFIVPIGSLYSQNKTIRGRVITEDLEIMSYTLIMINDTVEVGKVDLKGFFFINIPIYEKKILFMGIGLEATAIELDDKCEEVEVVMMFDGTYDFMTLKKVDRQRKKRFKKLPELHKKAFEKGIFKTEKACYTQMFTPYIKKKQK